MIRASIWTGVFFVLILGAATALAAVPGQINYQGYLTDPVGDPVTGTLDMEFTIWDADAGGSLLWTETWDTGTSQVDVTDGYFTVLLGSYTDFLTLFEEYSDLWLQVQVESAVLLPRKEIAAAAYGMVSAQADGLTVLITSDMIADYAVTEGKIASGAVTSDKIATGAVTSYKIASGAVDSDEIEDYSIQGSDIAADALGEDQIQDIYVLNTGDEMTGKLKISLPFVEGGAAEIGLASNSATGKLAVAMGGGTIASNNYTTAMGYSAVASGDVSTAMGYVTSASGDESTAMGTFTEASGSRSTAMGRETTASGESSTAIGWNTIASGDVSTAMGSYTVAGPGLHSTAMGCETTASGDISTAMGRLITVAGDYSFGIGLDSTARTVNADHVMAIMGGNVGIGTTAPASKLDVVGVARATQFQDGDDTAYSVDPAGSSHLYNLTLGTGAVVDNQQTGIDWGGDSYGIYRESGAWSHPYPDLRIAFYSGIKMGANSSYGGVRFYNNSDMITPIMSVGNGNNNVHVDYGLTVGGNVGIGTVSPGYLLDVDGTASVNDLTVSGNVGIGTVSPGYLLDVDGTASVNDLTVSGYVGIGTESPATPLDVNGKLKVSVPFGAGGAAEIGLAANSATGINAIAMGGNTTASNNYATATGYQTTASGDVSTAMGRGITAQGENSFGIGLDSAARTITAAHTMAIVGGNVGIGTVSPGSYTLYVNGTAYSTGGWSGSDQRWKKNIAPLENSLDRVRDLSGVSFEFRNGELDEIEFPEGRQIGLIAQEVEKVVPEVVRTDDDGYKAVAYEKLTALLVEAVKELDAENIELRAENEDMRREVDELRVEMEGLKALLGIAPTSFKTKAGR